MKDLSDALIETCLDEAGCSNPCLFKTFPLFLHLFSEASEFGFNLAHCSGAFVNIDGAVPRNRSPRRLQLSGRIGRRLVKYYVRCVKHLTEQVQLAAQNFESKALRLIVGSGGN